jgi:phospholipid/cholesterol/gamma-HCH transport system substrate-binding protein
MEATASEKFRLGVFILCSSVLLIAFLLFLAGRALLVKEVRYYTVFTETVMGLNPGAKVRLNGVNVGQVTTIEVDTNDVTQVRVWFSVMPGTPIKPGMLCNLVGGLSITGLKSIELTGGNSHQPTLVDGSQIPAGTSQMKQLTGQAESIALKFETALNNLASLTGDENQANLALMLRNLARITSNIDTLIDNNQKHLEMVPQNLNTAIASLKDASLKSKELIEELTRAEPGKKLTKALASFEQTATIINKKVDEVPLKQMGNDLSTAAKSMESAGKRADVAIYRIQEDLTTSIRHLKETMENMNDFSRQIKENPSLLLRGEDKQERRR